MRAVEAGVSASLPFSLSTSLSAHSAGARDLVLVRATVPREHLPMVTYRGFVFVQVVLVGSLRPSVYTIEGGLRTTGCRCCHGHLDFFPKFPERVVVGIPMQYSRKDQCEIGEVAIFTTLSAATLSTELRRYSKPSTSNALVPRCWRT